MLFNSFAFLLFLIIVFLLYWSVFSKKNTYRNLFLLIVSYVFYGWWDYRFLGLILLSTVVDYFIGRQLERTGIKKKRKLLFILSLSVNLGTLAFFKYYNFFIESWVDAWSILGYHIESYTLHIILPVGISFYTFQTLSYTIDIYRKQLKPTNSFIDFAAFVSFFPQLVAGPIERASHLLPQFEKKFKFDFKLAKSGLHLIIWGLLKKVVIADSCAIYVNEIFKNYDTLNTVSLILGSVYFAFQIYGDFSGYSDMAIGIARLFGFNLKRNFNYPYFSRDIAEFWRNWHISLTTWFRDYLYIPMGGSRVSTIKKVRNTFVVFLVSGFWHGANWTFIVWGFLNALYFLPLLLAKKNRINISTIKMLGIKQTLSVVPRILITFFLTCFAWIFFRADSVEVAFKYISNMVNFNFGIEFLGHERYSVELLLLLVPFVLVEWFNKLYEEPISRNYEFIKLSLCILVIFMFGSYSNPQDFIYFQF
ncbi:MBOAT family O-acyltransferase [Flavivirga rizhaonensis]|uniref:MBOAT family protein n=1 Tax=Flavivirga rizhaonensis TaxID=2559571 RepID=A0A4S1E1N8_9FLAO|nr:MBOAT family O-acyltransferase [Flavivirga rizhaonensis]TGV04429.1 MBOAT family protein [Flavivirga rizhaonensis]